MNNEMEYFFEPTDPDYTGLTFPDHEVTAQIQANAEPITEKKPMFSPGNENFQMTDRIAKALDCYSYDFFDKYPGDYRDRNEAMAHYHRLSDRLRPLVEKGLSDEELEAEALHLLFDFSLRPEREDPEFSY